MTVIPFPSPVRSPDAPPSRSPCLTSSECFEIAAAVSGLPGHWIVQWDEDERGQASMTLLPDEGEAADVPFVFLIWREDGCLQLYVRRQGRLAWLGAHAGIGSLIAAARRSLSRGRRFRVQPRAHPPE